MTLIATLVTNEIVTMVSDRLLTKGGRPYDDKSNKAVVVCSHMGYGYTGRAFIDSKRADDWLVDVLAQTKMGRITDVFEYVAERASEDFAKMPGSRTTKAHAFVVAGWAEQGERGPHRPFVGTISNALDDDWAMSGHVADSFKVRWVAFRDTGEPQIYWLGQPVPRAIQVDTRRTLRKRLTKGDGTRVAVRILVESVRRVAKDNDWVGADLMAVSIPREAVGKKNYMTVSAKDLFPVDSVGSQYFFANDDEGCRYQPHYLACVNGQFMPITHGVISFGENDCDELAGTKFPRLQEETTTPKQP